MADHAGKRRDSLFEILPVVQAYGLEFDAAVTVLSK
jgi:hypothetical protein